MKRLTAKYWNTLEKGSRERALTACYPNGKGIVNMMLEEKPDPKNVFWKRVFELVKVPNVDSHYKTFINGVYYP